MKIDIEEFIEKEGQKIAENIFDKYGEEPVINHQSMIAQIWNGLTKGSVTNLKAREDIYKRAQQEATAFFAQHSEDKFDDKTTNILKSYLRARLKEPNKINKLGREELLANAINTQAVSLLADKGLIV